MARKRTAEPLITRGVSFHASLLPTIDLCSEDFDGNLSEFLREMAKAYAAARTEAETVPQTTRERQALVLRAAIRARRDRAAALAAEQREETSRADQLERSLAEFERVPAPVPVTMYDGVSPPRVEPLTVDELEQLVADTVRTIQALKPEKRPAAMKRLRPDVHARVQEILARASE